MEVEVTHHIDASERDAQGMYEYYYEYDIYRFTGGKMSCAARSYVDEPEAAHFLRISEGKRERFLRETDFQSPLLVAAIDYLRSAGKRKLNWLSGEHGGYTALPRQRLESSRRKKA